ncbi:MAG: T9SS type A sorting domain-containing protein [Flavobacterium sp.]|nr:T9SS type A sorting domain-containing protein [Flavobacterium sp.]
MKKLLNNSHLRKIFYKDFKIINFKMGRLVKEYIFNEHIGIQVVDLNQMSQGVYIVLLKENGIIAEQQKLIVK